MTVVYVLLKPGLVCTKPFSQNMMNKLSIIIFKIKPQLKAYKIIESIKQKKLRQRLYFAPFRNINMGIKCILYT